MNILIPDSWLREYLITKASAKQIMECLSLCGPSVERIKKVKSDFIYDIEITSNRIDTASVYGIAREASAILPRFGIPATLKPIILIRDNFSINHSLPFTITDKNKLCRRILGVIMEVSGVKPSPLYVTERLEKSGIRSLNNLVDITNYVMLEMGHPCHVFDYDRIKTHTFIIRKAKMGEEIITLDNKKYNLSEEDVIIDDGTGKVIDLPGIMGTENSIVTVNTKRIIFFIESNNPELIRKTSLRYGIRTMAATINEKQPDCELSKKALLRGIELYRKLADGKESSGIYDLYPVKTVSKKITTTFSFINSRIGITIHKREIIDILNSLEFTTKETKDVLTVLPPSYRQFDVRLPEDIIEEVARIYGYQNLPVNIPGGKIPVRHNSEKIEFEEKIKNILKYLGFTETYSYSLISGQIIEKLGMKTSDHLKLSNPLTKDIEYLRTTLIGNLLQNINKNQKIADNLNLFELSKVYSPVSNNLPEEKPILVLSDQHDFYTLKGYLEYLLSELGIKEYEQERHQSRFFHYGQTLSLCKQGKILCVLGKADPIVSQNFNLDKATYIAEINLNELFSFYTNSKNYIEPTMTIRFIEDFTFIMPEDVTYIKLINLIKKTSNSISEIIYISSFKNSHTLKIIFQNPENNITAEDVKNTRKLIINTVLKMGIKLKESNI
jgi:phenylalanyl-tRNA synthetase beta chain